MKTKQRTICDCCDSVCTKCSNDFCLNEGKHEVSENGCAILCGKCVNKGGKMKPKHTPGKWTVSAASRKPKVGENAQYCTHYYVLTDPTENPVSADEANANAALIAMAPSLLKGLKLAVLEFERISYQKKCNPELLDALKLAIAKAEWRTE